MYSGQKSAIKCCTVEIGQVTLSASKTSGFDTANQGQERNTSRFSTSDIVGLCNPTSTSEQDFMLD